MSAFRRLTTTPTTTTTVLAHFLHSYRITTSALPQLNPDHHHNHYNYYNHDDDPPIPLPVLDSQTSQPSRGVHWVFIGGNYNAKRHVYAQLISNLIQVPHISITTLLRQHLSPRSILYKQIADAINHGKLVPESIIFGLLSKRLEDGHDRGETGFILDGIPRTRLHADFLNQLVDIDLVVNFKCSEDCFHRRSPTDSSASSNKARTTFPGFDRAAVDAEPKVLSSYKEQLKSLEEYYQSQKKLIDIQVGNTPVETWKRLLAALRLQHIKGVHSNNRLQSFLRV